VEPDHCPEDPSKICDGAWSIYPFSSHADFAEYLKAEFGEPVRPDARPPILSVDFKLKKNRDKEEKGLAYKLSKYEHGDEVWYLGGEYRGVDHQWDGTDYAGVMIWENPEEDIGAKTPEDRAKDAKAWLDEWTAWRNGHVYDVHLEDAEGEMEDPRGPWCGSLYSKEHAIEVVLEVLDLDEDEIMEVTGECSFLLDDVNWPDVIKKCREQRAENLAKA
jgi:hypothetical protein